MPERTIVRTAMLLLASGLVVATGCSGPDSATSSPGMGRVQVDMGAASTGTVAAASTGTTPVILKSLEVTVQSLRARMEDGTWQEIAGAYPETVDVLELEASGEVPIGSGLLPEGTYTALEVVISEAAATLSDGTTLVVDFQDPGRNVLLPVRFDVVEGEETLVHLRLNVDHSCNLADGLFEFEPDFAVEVGD